MWALMLILPGWVNRSMEGVGSFLIASVFSVKYEARSTIVSIPVYLSVSGPETKELGNY